MSALAAAVLVVLLAAMPAAAQIQSRPTDPPLVTAASESWYQLREPVQFAGELYYPAGPAVYFDGNRMVRTGHYNGVPLYADTTVEPFSIILVPVTRGLMQPYERLRRGDLAGTTGSRPPSFPVQVVPDASTPPVAAAAPTAPPRPAGAIGVFTPVPPGPAAVTPGAAGAVAVGTSGLAAAPPAVVATLQRPSSNDGIWVPFAGERWVSAGPAILLVPDEFLLVGEYAGFPVFARRGLQEEMIYLPTGTGMIAPYRLKP